MVLYQKNLVTINHEYQFPINAQTGHVSQIAYTLSKPNRNIDDFDLAQLAICLVNLAIDMRRHEKENSLQERLKICLSHTDNKSRNQFGVIEPCENEQHNTIFVYNPMTCEYYNILLDDAIPALVQVISKERPVERQTTYDLHENYLFITLCSELIYQAMF